MSKVILAMKRAVILLFILMSAIGFIISIILNVQKLLGYNIPPTYAVGLILGTPIIFIPSVIINFIKITEGKGINEKRYWMGFWSGIRNAPRWMTSVLNIIIVYLLFMILLSSILPDHGEKLLTGACMFFYYIPLLVYLSSYIETNHVKKNKR